MDGFCYCDFNKTANKNLIKSENCILYVLASQLPNSVVVDTSEYLRFPRNHDYHGNNQKCNRRYTVKLINLRRMDSF